MSDPLQKQEIRLKGVPASPGIVSAPGFLFQKRELDVPMYFIQESGIDAELERFDNALLETRRQIQAIRSDIATHLGEDEAKIFDAHLLVLEDIALIGETHDEVRRSKYNVEFCFHQISQKYIEFFNNIDDEYLKERVNDIRDVTRRLLSNLLGHSEATIGRLPEIAAGCILISKDLHPSDTSALHSIGLKGIITDTGGATSHTAIMARSLELPAVVGLHNSSDLVGERDTVLVDGYEGIVVINPSEETLAEYDAFRRRKETVAAVFSSEIAEPGLSLDHQHIPLMINIEGVREAEQLERLQADGVGLFRTESILLKDNTMVPEAQQFEEYKAVIEAAKGRPIVFRTFDLGGDKLLAAAGQQGRESNPFMGLRAIRYSLRFPEVFKTQLRAILRSSAFGPIKIMYPMVSGLGELLEANRLLEAVKSELDSENVSYDRNIEVGSMIEIPSAAVMSDSIAEHCSFLSIGTNDLIQYLLAVDRTNDMISDLYEPYHPAVIRTIKQIVDGAHSKGVKVSVCGEMAGDPIFSSLLIGLGVDELSVAPSSYAEIKYLIRHLSVERARQMADESLQLCNPIRIYQILKAFHIEIFRDILH
ncbi:MAG: phosphoenolpyruvate--protein phosphotransferase [Puniceicoccaceae bacterium]